MAITDNLRSIEFDRNESHIFGIKSAILWGNSATGSGALLYISKPKHISREDFEYLINHIDIELRK